MKADPRRVGGINLHFQIPASLRNLDEKEKNVLKNTAETCPVMQSINPNIEVKINWGEWS
jgi:uncharacterized OsmC-like protein